MTGASKPAEEFLGLYNSWLETYPIIGLVDPVCSTVSYLSFIITLDYAIDVDN